MLEEGRGCAWLRRRPFRVGQREIERLRGASAAKADRVETSLYRTRRSRLRRLWRAVNDGACNAPARFVTECSRGSAAMAVQHVLLPTPRHVMRQAYNALGAPIHTARPGDACLTVMLPHCVTADTCTNKWPARRPEHHQTVRHDSTSHRCRHRCRPDSTAERARLSLALFPLLARRAPGCAAPPPPSSRRCRVGACTHALQGCNTPACPDSLPTALALAGQIDERGGRMLVHSSRTRRRSRPTSAATPLHSASLL